MAFMVKQLSADAQSMSPEEEMSSRRGAIKLLLMNQARILDAVKVGFGPADSRRLKTWRSRDLQTQYLALQSLAESRFSPAEPSPGAWVRFSQAPGWADCIMSSAVAHKPVSSAAVHNSV